MDKEVRGELEIGAGTPTSAANTTRRVHESLAELDSVGIDAPTDGRWYATRSKGAVLLTPSDEVVLVRGLSKDTVRVTFPERDSIDAAVGGSPAPYEYDQDVWAFVARIEADGGWTLVRRFERVETINCPRRGCGKFMSIHIDLDELPFAQCACGGVVDHRDLIDSGAIAEVF